MLPRTERASVRGRRVKTRRTAKLNPTRSATLSRCSNYHGSLQQRCEQQGLQSQAGTG
jgi:hypothetical protein